MFFEYANAKNKQQGPAIVDLSITFYKFRKIETISVAYNEI
jgi:hypothetical protein